MRGLLVAILSAVALVAVVTGCGGARHYDGRLVAADSLMHNRPDSALALVQAVSADSLPVEADRAYRDLLLTQARYRCYVTATSDSDINRALAYYRTHDGEREKLTRAYIYKGAVMEELGHPDSAMYYYKYAETTAAPDDYFNLGYVKLRIAELYQGVFSQDSAAINHLHEAKKQFTLLNDTNYLIVTYGKLGALLATKAVDSSMYYFDEAIRLSVLFNPALQYTYKSKLSGLYLSQNDYLASNQLAMDVFYHGIDYSLDYLYYYYAIISYVKLNRIDSAQIILSQTPLPSDRVDSMFYYKSLADISFAKKDYKAHGKYVSLYKDIESHILINSNVESVVKSEIVFDIKQLKNHGLALTSRNKVFLWIIILAIVLLFLMIVIIYKLYFNSKNREKELFVVKQELELTIQNLSNYQHTQNSVSELLAMRLSAINELYQSIRVRTNDKNRVKKILPLSSVFELMDRNNELLDIVPSDAFWHKMRQSVEGEYNGILTYLEKQYPNLSDKDLKLFCLLCAKIPPQVIRLCMGYSNVRTVSNYRIKLIREKIGLNISFDDFIKHYLNNEFGESDI